MINTIIIDDEAHASNRLSRLLEEYHSEDMRITGIFESVDEGISGIRNLNPDLVFLDVQLHDKTGFDLLQEISQKNFAVIFTTAFEKYAVRAFRFSAIDYLLKPVDPDDLSQALDRVRESISKNDLDRKLETLFHNIKNTQGVAKRITIPTANGLTILGVDEIIRCQAHINYTSIHTTDGQKIVVAKTLKEFEELLGDYNFFRVHNSHLINLAFVKSYDRGKGGIVHMRDGSHSEVSTRRKEEFLRKLAAL